MGGSRGRSGGLSGAGGSEKLDFRCLGSFLGEGGLLGLGSSTDNSSTSSCLRFPGTEYQKNSVKEILESIFQHKQVI